jgi:hypothetical protein
MLLEKSFKEAKFLDQGPQYPFLWQPSQKRLKHRQMAIKGTTKIPPVIPSLTCRFFNLKAVSTNPTKNKEGNPEWTHTPVTRELNLP